ncbi:MAG: ATP-binding protein [Verrucomicrobia bacterium]|nr:ATP-binding protein [Verrucomicrobiota bacterium]
MSVSLLVRLRAAKDRRASVQSLRSDILIHRLERFQTCACLADRNVLPACRRLRFADFQELAIAIFRDDRDRLKFLGYLSEGVERYRVNLLFQVISQRYERGSIVITSNKAFKQWPAIFNGDSTITSAALDRLLHHAETILIEGSRYRMNDRVEA